ncbi:hypothetical protein DH2020_009272 [Rehmannia glutinosa]|uniref:RRM domain-containing protein n=1 Tax=Rehmannia glutinosa TaxID=99300 RepID=A0ABR0X8W0_REHGL
MQRHKWRKHKQTLQYNRKVAQCWRGTNSDNAILQRRWRCSYESKCHVFMPTVFVNSRAHEDNAVKGTEVFVGGLPGAFRRRKSTRLTMEEKWAFQVVMGHNYLKAELFWLSSGYWIAILSFKGLGYTVLMAVKSYVFSACGEIVEIRLIKDKNGSLKGFCFVRFATKESAARAVREKSGTVLDGKKIGVLPSSEQDTLYFGNLNKAWSADEFERIVLQVFPDIESIDLPMLKDTPPGQKQRNRGFAFVKFSSHAAASRAQRVGSQPEFRLGNLHPAVQWAEEEHGIDAKELAKIKIAFVRNLPIDAEENYLKQLFEPFGKVEKVVVSKKGSSPVGFVHFAERLDLERAIKELNEKTVQGPSGGPVCKLQVEVARPMDRNKKRVHENSESTSVQGDSKLVKPNHHNPHIQRELESADPYEDAVIALPLAVKERLLESYDSGLLLDLILKELPESAAITVLDQFMLSGAALQNKGAYLDGLISRHLVDKVGSSQSLGSLPKVADSTRNELKPFSISPDIYGTRYSSLHSDYPLPSRTLIGRADEKGLSDYPLPSRTLIGRLDEKGLSDYPLSNRTLIGRGEEKGLSDYPFSNRTLMGRADEKGPESLLANRTLMGRADEKGLESLLANRSLSGSQSIQIPRIGTMEERSLSPYEPIPVPTLSYGRVQLRTEEHDPAPAQAAPISSTSNYAGLGVNLGSNVSTAAGHQESRPQIRFDPFTGEPYKFDPFTGEPIRPVNNTTRQI